MFEVLVIVFIVSLFTAFILMGGLFIFRIVYAWRFNADVLKRLAIIFLPGGMGLYHHAKNDERTLTRYRVAVLTMFVFALIGSFYIAFLNMHWVSNTFFYGL